MRNYSRSCRNNNFLDVDEMEDLRCRLDDCDLEAGRPNNDDEQRADDRLLEESDILEPYVGQMFGSEIEGYNFYNAYVKAISFSVRKNRTHLDEMKQIKSRNICCSKEGKKKRQVVNKTYEKGDS